MTRDQLIRRVASAIDDATSGVLTDHIVGQAAAEAVEVIEENGACLHTWAHPAQPFKRHSDPHGCTYRSGGDCASIGVRLHCKLGADHQPLGHDYKNINGAGCEIEGLCSHVADPEAGRMCLQTRETHGTPHAMEVSGPYVLKVEGRA